MARIWIITNSGSASTNAGAIADLHRCFEEHDVETLRTIDLAEDDLPDLSDLTQEAPDFIASFGGDGTAVALADRYGTDGASPILVLPGGTMNLLSARLHGEAGVEEIIAAALSNPHAEQLPQVEGPGFFALTGVVAGSTARWGDVREELRQGDLGGMLRAAGDALDATLQPGAMHVEGSEEAHSALFIHATTTELRAEAIMAENLGDVARHGIAWLKRDFLGGPTEPVAHGEELRLSGPERHIDLLVDGERDRADNPLTLRHGRSAAWFLRTAQTPQP
ncbi:diacylglycerol kinase family protein [Sphingobium subterraneum]|uniref:DAGKc domain-containing protein n=1 Tax=Sphingobium subterraneum TaxID=627688 RepID=A0A841J7A2_9SPHN|nr:diacylglycerol kinase family protein [Sphingobium subterraneum]MBB6124405.1 hypothetical protein [Sphingobium subterraneum]